MLKNIDPLLNADLLYALQSMGHGDTIAIVDANFPAHSKSKNRLITLSGCTATEVLKAILTLLPLDDFEPYPIKTMSQAETDDATEASLDFLQIISLSDEQRHQAHQVERFEFYDLVNQAQLVVSTTDMRPYACLILQKGVIF